MKAQAANVACRTIVVILERFFMASSETTLFMEAIL
jgi:hypothetical protein